MSIKRQLCFLLSATAAMYASADLPVKLVNNSNGQFADEDIFVAILGKEGKDETLKSIYYDLAATSTSQQSVTKQLDLSVNRLHIQADDWGYADVFTKMSDIKDQTIYLGNTFACRIFFAFKSPMYLHAFEDGGYTGADMNNPSDPNADIRWELIEFTYEPTFEDVGQIWINTTRVDAFQYPMGLELYSAGNRSGSTPYIQRGEYIDYVSVLKKWNTTYAGNIYSNCYSNPIGKDDLGGIIKQPSKVESVKKADIFDEYINKIWDYYRSHTANIRMGVLGRWEGSVEGDVFTLTCVEGTYWAIGSQAHIYGKPSTEDAIEGAGQFANAIAGGNQANIDLTVQAMFCAAFNRGQFRTQTELQDWDPVNGIKAFCGGSEFPCNEYVRFFHDTDITVSNGATYAFAYDDTFDQSATCYSVAPTSAVVTIGGFVNITSPSPEPTPDPEPQEIPAAPTPDKDASKVKSIFSGAYSAITPNLMVGYWGQQTQTSIQPCGNDDAFALTNFDFIGLQFSSDDVTVDVSDTKYLHIDIYAVSEMDIDIYPISLNPTIEQNVQKHLTAGQWNQFDIAISEFPNVDFTNLGQFKFDKGSGQSLYIDNIYFWTDSTIETPETPDDPDDSIPAPPTPTTPANSVISFVSNHYTSDTPDMFIGSWGQATANSKEMCENENIDKLSNFDFIGFQLVPGDGTIDASGINNIHVDLYAVNDISVNFHPISLNPTVDTDLVVLNLKGGEWNSFDISTTSFPNINFSSLGQFKIEDSSRKASAPAASQRAASADEKTIYLANLYGWNDTTTGIENIAASLESEAGDVYDLYGRFVRHGQSTEGLPRGIYIINGRKVAVTR